MTRISYPRSEVYSGQSLPGLNNNASYDRMVFTDRDRTYDVAQLSELLVSLYESFQNSQRSRMVARVLAETSVAGADFNHLHSLVSGLEIDAYPDVGQRFQYLTLSVNDAQRSIDGQIYSQIMEQTRRRVESLQQVSFCESAHQILDAAEQNRMTPTLEIEDSELIELWGPFEWSREAIASVLQSGSEDVVMGLRDQNDELVAAALYNDQSHGEVRHGESTEWAALRPGTIQTLLLIFHAYLLDQGIENIWADLRTPDPERQMPNSIRPAMRSGMSIFQAYERFVSSNHVVIAGEPQSYLEQSTAQFADVPARSLRSFVKGWVNPHHFSSDISERALNMLAR